MKRKTEKCHDCECYNCINKYDCFECQSCNETSNFVSEQKTKCGDRKTKNLKMLFR